MDDNDSFYVYLNSIGNILEYPENTVSNFTNLIQPNINLNGTFSVGLENIFFQENFYTGNKNDTLFQIDIRILYYKNKIIRGSDSISYTPSINFSSKTVDSIVTFIDSDLRSFLHTQKIINKSHKMLLARSPITGSVVINEIQPLNNNNFKYDKIVVKWKFALMIAHVLGLDNNNIELINPKPTRYPSLPLTVSNIFVYSDIIESSRMGDRQTNILDILPIGNTFSKNMSSIIYKTVKYQNISNISISLKDQFGRNIPFLDGNIVTAILHFKRQS